jgi:[ribosomal protein S18]-alanine N-acetyltransferase
LDIDDPIIIRSASDQHTPGMLRVERHSPTAAHWSEAQYECLFQPDEGPNSRFALVAERGTPGEESGRPARVVGFLIARHVVSEWELENIVVAPEVRGRGIGTRLMKELLARATQTGSHSVFLEVRESNAPARALYQKLGFLQTGRRKSYYNNPVEDAILYCKNLGSAPISS